MIHKPLGSSRLILVTWVESKASLYKSVFLASIEQYSKISAAFVYFSRGIKPF